MCGDFKILFCFSAMSSSKWIPKFRLQIWKLICVAKIFYCPYDLESAFNDKSSSKRLRINL